MFMGALRACASVYHVGAWHPQRPEEDVEPSGTESTDNCEPPNMEVLDTEPGSFALLVS